MEILEFIDGHPYFSGGMLVVTTIWLYSYFTCGVCKSKARMDGKTVIITGANSGIGKSTAFDLARRGARVIMACRNMEKSNLVRVLSRSPRTPTHTSTQVRLLDVSLLRSVRQFAEEIIRTERRLDVLIHNAGIGLPGNLVTEEGLQLVWATNHFGPFLLTHLLIDLLKKTENSRIVVVSSVMHTFGRVDPNNPNPVQETGKFKLYCTTKFANVIFANELARRLKGTGITCNSLHPGVIITSLWDSCPIWIIVIGHLPRLFYKTEDQGAQTTVYLAVSEEVQGVTGKYFSDCKETTPAKKTLDVGLAKKFWEASEEVVKLKPTDPHL